MSLLLQNHLDRALAKVKAENTALRAEIKALKAEREIDEKGQAAIDWAKEFYAYSDDIRINDAVDSDCDGGSWVSADFWIEE